MHAWLGMNPTIKNPSTAKRTLLLWTLLLSPLCGVATFMIAAHHGLDNLAAWKLTAAVLVVCWALVYGVTLWLHRRRPQPE